MNRLPLWAGVTSLLVSSFSLGMSAWAIGCGSNEPVAREAVREAPPAVLAVAKDPAASTRPVVERAAEAPPEPAARPAPAPLRVKRLVVARGVAQREPVEAGSEVALNGKPIYAFVEMVNPSDQAQGIVISFEGEGERTGDVELEIPANAARWRTWGLTRGVRKAGSWTAVVRSASGEEIARQVFTVEEPSA